MASSEIDQKFLGRMAKAVENDNSILSATLFKLLGLSLRLSDKLVEAKRHRRPDPSFHELVMRILWLAREGLKMLQEYVFPFTSSFVELKVLAFKLRASFHHIFVLFRNEPRASKMAPWDPEAVTTAMVDPFKSEKGKGIATHGGVYEHEQYEQSFMPHRHHSHGGPVLPPPGFEAPMSPMSLSFLLPAEDYLPLTNHYFEEAVAIADKFLWGSHSLRLSVKTEYAAFLYECAHDVEGSRELAKLTINEVYEATEGMDDDMFRDACELVTVLGKMMRRGLASGNAQLTQAQASNLALSTGASPPIGMENPI